MKIASNTPVITIGRLWQIPVQQAKSMSDVNVADLHDKGPSPRVTSGTAGKKGEYSSSLLVLTPNNINAPSKGSDTNTHRNG